MKNTVIENFILQYTINERDAMIKALCLPDSMPKSFAINPLIPIAWGTFKGDSMPPRWSVNDKFVKGTKYPIYDGENGFFVVGSDGVGYKLVHSAWSKLKYL
jgi:hypothetical protein